MELKQLQSDESGVSPVIGVILMVAITVILAAVIASFVLGLGPNTSTAPQASFSSDYDSTDRILTISMDSGNNVDATNVYIRGDVGSAAGGSPDITSAGSWSSATSISEITAGEDVAVGVSSGGTEIQLVHEEGDTSSVMQTFEI